MDYFYTMEKILQECPYKGQEILSIHLEYPVFVGNREGIRAINRRFLEEAKRQEMILSVTWLQQAKQMYEDALSMHFPFRPFEIFGTVTPTLHNHNYISAYSDLYQYTGGAHGNTVRSSVTYHVPDGSRVQLADLFLPGYPYKKMILAEIYKQIQGELQKEPGKYFEDAPQSIVEAFREQNFFLTPEGLAVYYPLYELAPYVVGIPVFVIPYRDLADGLRYPLP